MPSGTSTRTVWTTTSSWRSDHENGARWHLRGSWVQAAPGLAGRTPATEGDEWGAEPRSAVPVDPRDAVATATVLDAARRSATEGLVVRL
jgi:hypothetical protein